jgi:hypothetical protein
MSLPFFQTNCSVTACYGFSEDEICALKLLGNIPFVCEVLFTKKIIEIKEEHISPRILQNYNIISHDSLCICYEFYVKIV